MHVKRTSPSQMHVSGEALDSWRIRQGWSYSDLAREIAVTPQAARRYCLGFRLPEPAVMVRIRTTTKQAVTADSFVRPVAEAADLL